MSKVATLILELAGIVLGVYSFGMLVSGNWWGLATGVAAILMFWIGFLAEEEIDEREEDERDEG